MDDGNTQILTAAGIGKPRLPLTALLKCLLFALSMTFLDRIKKKPWARQRSLAQGACLKGFRTSTDVSVTLAPPRGPAVFFCRAVSCAGISTAIIRVIRRLIPTLS